MQLLKRKAEKNKGEEESKVREKKPPAAPAKALAIDADLARGSLAQNRNQERKGKEPPDKEEPGDAVAALGVGSDVDFESHLKTEHSTLIELLRRRKEKREKDCTKERKGTEGEDLKLKEAKLREKEEEMKSPVILGTKKGKDAEPEEPHLLHIGTPFEVLNCNSRIISFFSRFAPSLDIW